MGVFVQMRIFIEIYIFMNATNLSRTFYSVFHVTRITDISISLNFAHTHEYLQFNYIAYFYYIVRLIVILRI